MTTGYGSAVRTGEARDGDTVVVMGVGGIGINAVQGARIAGARNIVALDPVEYKRTRSLEFGATHTAATVPGSAGAGRRPDPRRDGRRLCGDHVIRGGCLRRAKALSLVGKRGRVVMTAIPHPTDSCVDYVAVRPDTVRKAGPRLTFRILQPAQRHPQDAGDCTSRGS